jgi:hypothetical protein
VATRKKGVITPALAAPPWLVHLRPDGKKQFWKRERREQMKQLQLLGEEEAT